MKNPANRRIFERAIEFLLYLTAAVLVSITKVNVWITYVVGATLGISLSLLIDAICDRRKQYSKWFKVAMYADDYDEVVVRLNSSEYAAVQSFLEQVKEYRSPLGWAGDQRRWNERWVISSPCSTKDEALKIKVLFPGEDRKNTRERKDANVKQDIKLLISYWFLALEDEGVDPWQNEDCVVMADKYQYTIQDYETFLRTLS